ncbi:hypothetical protein [Spirosoma utsteinense]|uniref:Bacteriocin n=1 Tax=Spirosoma utsteinense TaxID=2585773 RepID=A0ABR6W3Q8_9BACT|nr:hypothetical protein [Spirosoma utsteinense]MBC3791243.1 hypothetical protein [Spirosoma utsteinense]
MQNLTEKEAREVNGGSEATYNAFHEAGKAIHDAVVSAWNEVASWF